MTLPHSSRLAGLKDYISQGEMRFSRLSSKWTATPSDSEEGRSPPGRNAIHNWSKWAGQMIRRTPTDTATVDEVHLCPGWATKQPRQQNPGEPENTFDIVFHVSGFATSRRTPEFLTRSQRAFLKLARTFASIPKPQLVLQPPDTTELQDFADLHLPPRPDEISDDYDFKNLDAQFRNSGNQSQDADDTQYASQLPADTIPVELERLHENMESRLKLFWASSLSSRRIQLSVFLHSPDLKPHWPSLDTQPVLTHEMLTGTDGHFSGTFTIDWGDISSRPVGTRVTSNRAHAEHELLVEARIINTERTPELHDTPTSIMHIPITHSALRVISDIDDTVKLSRVVDGARAIFHQVFVKDLEDTIIPEMGEWYGEMWRRGVCFHYVSNSPIELLPVINEFIGISNLPVGSIRLRSYAGRSLLEGLLSAPATRKKGNVVEVLDQFRDSQFILVGDSGEQDLELYSSLAAERPGQIAGVFIRDVSALGLEDPTGLKADFGLTNSPIKIRSRGATPLPGGSIPPRIVPKRAASDTDIFPGYSNAIHISYPTPIKHGSLPPTSFSFDPSPDYKPLSRLSEDSSSSIASIGSSLSSSARSTRQTRPITEAEKRRMDLQNRVNKARLTMPSHVALRVFEDPRECVEAEQIIHRLMNVS